MATKTHILCASLLLFCLLAPANTLAQPNLGVVEGVCQREWSSTHSGTKVIFRGLTEMARTDSTTTREMGHFCIGLPRGIYAVFFEYEGYQTQPLPDYYIFSTNRYQLPDMLLRLPAEDGMHAGVPLSRPLNAHFTLRGLVDPGLWFGDHD